MFKIANFEWFYWVKIVKDFGDLKNILIRGHSTAFAMFAYGRKTKSKMASQYRSIVWVLNLEFRCTKPLSQDLRMAGHVPGSSTSSSVTEGRIFSVLLTKKKQSKPKRGPTSGFHFLFQSCIFSSPGFCLRALVAVLQRYFDVQISKIYHPFSHF